MPTALASSNAPRGLPRVIQGVIVCGFIVGPLLTFLAGLLPERAESIASWLGLGTMLASVSVALAYLARKNGLGWRGISPVAGILIGALPFLAVDGWNYFAHRRPSVAQQAQAAARHAITPPHAPPWAALRPRPALGPDPRVAAILLPQRPSNPQGTDNGLEGALDKLADTLNAQGRAAARATLMSALASAQGDDTGSVRSKIVLAQRDVADFQASLDRIRSENPSFSQELEAALGDTAPLVELDAGLQEFSDSTAGAQRLRATSVKLNTWITACNQRIATAKAEVAGPSAN